MKLNNKGFTLVELLAVLAILITILLIAIPSITSSLSRSEQKEIEAKKQLITSTIEIEMDKNMCFYKKLIDSTCGLAVEDLAENGWITDDIAKDNNGNYIKGYVMYNKELEQYEFIDGELTIRDCFGQCY
mgnify:CR=1 FL=1